jgi:hypothetical protein
MDLAPQLAQSEIPRIDNLQFPRVKLSVFNIQKKK